MNLLRLAFGVIALALATCGGASAQYPTRPVRLVVGFAAGGPTDILARRMAQYLSEKLGQQFIVENKPGATGNVATEYVLNAAPDGYTILVTTTANAINMTFYSKLSFDFLRDATPVAGLASISYMMLLNPGVPAKTVPEFIAYAKANPAKVNMASPGVGTAPHVNGELFKMMAGVDMVHVPYRGDGPALTDLVAGQVHVMFGNLISAIEHIRGGRLRALAVTTATPSPALPDVPTVAATVPGYEASAWFGLGAPRATPADVVARINKEINASLADPKLAARLAELGGAPMPLSPQAFDAFIAAETEKWGKVVRMSGAKAN